VSQTGLVLSRLVTLTGWSFVAASACLFFVVAAIVHGTFSLVEHTLRRARLWGRQAAQS